MMCSTSTINTVENPELNQSEFVNCYVQLLCYYSGCFENVCQMNLSDMF